MAEYIAFDAHKRYTWVDREDHSTGEVHQHRLEHVPAALRRYLSGCAAGSSVAVEATGNWYWIMDEIEQAGMRPLLVHPHKAKLMMGLTNKTDQLDAQGLNCLQHNGTLPTVWIPAGPLRDLRELTRTRVMFALRTEVNRYLKWAFAEAANSVAVNHRRRPGAPCEPVVPALAAAQRAPQGSRSGGAALGRSRLSRPARRRILSRSGSWSRSDQRGVSANVS